MAADFITEFISNLGMDFSSPITLAINIILSTIIGGIILLIIVEIFGKKYSENVKPVNAFLAVLIINLINILGITAFLMPYVSFIPLISWVLPIVIWIVIIKILFREMSIVHSVIVGLIGFAVTLLLLPALVGIASGFLPI